MLENYEINNDTLAVIPYEFNKSKVMEEEAIYIVNKSPNKIIDESCRYFGSSYNGRFEGTKSLLGFNYKAPIIIEETRKIIFFPTSSPRNECIWVALKNINKYEKNNKESRILFKNGKTIDLPLSYNSLENQILRASRLETILNDRIINKNK